MYRICITAYFRIMAETDKLFIKALLDQVLL